MAMITSTRQFVDLLRREGELLEISEEVSPFLELAEIQRRVVGRSGPAILFQNVKGTPFPVATNLYGSQKRIDLAFGGRAEKFIGGILSFLEDVPPIGLSKLWRARGLFLRGLRIGTKDARTGPVMQRELAGANLKILPQIQCWPEDGGAFITLPLVYTEDPVTGKSNLGMYRIQLHGGNECGMHIQIHRGGGFHYHQAEKRNLSLPVHIYIGGPPALTLSAVAPLPEDVPEILLASILFGRRIPVISKNGVSALPLLADADFCIVGEISPHERKPEGPFGDHYGYYSLRHDYPYMRVRRIFHRDDAVYPATVVGKPPQEDHFIACYLQELFAPLIRRVMPQVKDLWAHEESGVHSLACAVVRERYPREALTAALRILGEGQLSLTKVLMVTDQNGLVKDFRSFLPLILERMDFSKDIFILSNISQDTLDYTGPRMNEGSKAILLGVGEPIRKLPTAFHGTFTNNIFKNPRVFCPGALAVTGPAYVENDSAAQTLAHLESVKDWPLVFLLDDAESAVSSAQEFIWQVFTRFEPARDIHARRAEVVRYHTALMPPVVIDCRMKPWYPKVLQSDMNVVKKLEPLFKKYGL